MAGAVNVDASAADFEERVARLDEGATYLVYARTAELSKFYGARAPDHYAQAWVMVDFLKRGEEKLRDKAAAFGWYLKAHAEDVWSVAFSRDGKFGCSIEPRTENLVKAQELLAIAHDNGAIEHVAAQLGNTVAVCRKSYIHPEIVEAYLDRSLLGKKKGAMKIEVHDVLKIFRGQLKKIAK